MTIGTVSNSNIVSQLWKNVYDIINTTITDPKSRSKWIYSSWPAEEKGTADTFPRIIIDGASIDSEQFVMGSKKLYKWTVPIYVYDTHMGTCDSLADSVVEKLNANAGSFTTYGFFQPIVSISSPTTVIINGNIVHERRMDLDVEGDI